MGRLRARAIAPTGESERLACNSRPVRREMSVVSAVVPSPYPDAIRISIAYSAACEGQLPNGASPAASAAAPPTTSAASPVCGTSLPTR